MSQCVNPSIAETRIFKENLVNIAAVDVLVPCIGSYVINSYGSHGSGYVDSTFFPISKISTACAISMSIQRKHSLFVFKLRNSAQKGLWRLITDIVT